MTATNYFTLLSMLFYMYFMFLFINKRIYAFILHEYIENDNEQCI